MTAPPSQPLRDSRSQPTGAPRSHPLMTAPPSQPLRGSRSQPVPGPRSQPQRLQLSGLIEERIRGETLRKQRRAWLANTVVLAQALITLMVVPGYVIPAPNLPVLLTLGVALVFYLAAFLFNRLRRDLDVAYYMLIGGGALATAAQVFVTASLSYDSAHTAQAAMLFLPIILEAGLFLSPELTLLVASAAAIVTASAILLALALGSDASSQLNDAYLVMVYALGLEAFIGFLAWRLAQFMYETLKSAQADEDLRFTQARLSAAESRMNEQRSLLTQDVGAIQMAVSNALAHEYDTRIEISEGELAPLALSLNLLIQQLRSTNDLERQVQSMKAQAVPLVEMAGRLATGAMPSVPGETPTDSALYSVRAALSQAQTMNARRQARLQEVAAEISNSLRHSREVLVNTANESAQAQAIAGQLVSLVEMLNQTAVRQADLLAQARRALALILPPELIQSELADGSLRESPGRDSATTGDLAGLGADLGILNRYTNEFRALDPVDPNAAGISPLTAPLPAIRPLAPSDSASGEAAADDAGAAGSSVASQGELPASLTDAWLLLSLLQLQTSEEARAVQTFVHDIGVLSKHVRRTGMHIDWVNQAMDATERGAEQMQQLASPSGASADLDDEMGGAGMARPDSASIPRRTATHPLDTDARLAAAQASLPPEPPAPDAAPGSLRVSELFAPEAFGSAGAPSTPTSTAGEAPSVPRDETDTQTR